MDFYLFDISNSTRKNKNKNKMTRAYVCEITYLKPYLVVNESTNQLEIKFSKRTSILKLNELQYGIIQNQHLLPETQSKLPAYNEEPKDRDLKLLGQELKMTPQYFNPYTEEREDIKEHMEFYGLTTQFPVVHHKLITQIEM